MFRERQENGTTQMLTQLERRFDIPFPFRNEKWLTEASAVWMMYRLLSASTRASIRICISLKFSNPCATKLPSELGGVVRISSLAILWAFCTGS
jgi:hypothetical protein